MANQTSRPTAKKRALPHMLSLMLPLLILTGCARQTPVNETLPLLAQLREQQQAEQPQLQLHYAEQAIALASEQEQQLHQFLGRKDPARVALVSGPGPQTDMLESARLASKRLHALSQLLAARAIELLPSYDPMLAPNTLLIRILPAAGQDAVAPSQVP